MAFTYVGDLSTDRDKTRFYLQDTVSDSGPKPSGGNFTDAEIDGLITVEGTWQKATAAGYEVLAAAWAKYADLQTGPIREQLSQIATRYAQAAKEKRAQFGYTATATASVAHITRVDGYSADIASDED